MIYLYTGTPGSGKSLDAARMIRNQLALKHPVICNFPINEECVKNPDLFEYRDNDELTPEYLMQYAKKYFKFGRHKAEDY